LPFLSTLRSHSRGSRSTIRSGREERELCHLGDLINAFYSIFESRYLSHSEGCGSGDRVRVYRGNCGGNTVSSPCPNGGILKGRSWEGMIQDSPEQRVGNARGFGVRSSGTSRGAGGQSKRANHQTPSDTLRSDTILLLVSSESRSLVSPEDRLRIAGRSPPWGNTRRRGRQSEPSTPDI
jgi:hypothetical protein